MKIKEIITAVLAVAMGMGLTVGLLVLWNIAMDMRGM